MNDSAATIPVSIQTVSLRRSGSHAVSNWLASQWDESICFVNDASYTLRECELSTKSDPLPSLKKKHPQRDFRNPGPSLLFSFEESSLLEAREHPLSERIRSRTDKFFTSIVLRDPYNLFASRLKILRERPQNASFNNLLLRDKETGQIGLPELWKTHAKEFLGITEELGGTPLHVNYNKWLVDPEYRETLSHSIGCTLNDECRGQVPGYGFGSSFDNQRFDGDATEMNLTTRWKTMQHDPVFRSLIDDEELRSLTHEIFGTIVSSPPKTQFTGSPSKKRASSKNLIATMQIGEVPYSKFTLPGVRAYAERCNADFFVVTDKDQRYRKCFSANKFQTLTKLVEEDYDRLLFLDLDILISPDAPNIFEQYGEGVWAMPAFEGMRRRYLANMSRYLGRIPETLDASSYANAGVILIDRTNASALLPHLEPPLGPWTEQGILHWACHQAKIPIQALPPEWNCMERLCKTTPAPHIVHIAGKKREDFFWKRLTRLVEIQPALREWVNPDDYRTEQITPSQSARGSLSPKM